VAITAGGIGPFVVTGTGRTGTSDYARSGKPDTSRAVQVTPLTGNSSSDEISLRKNPLQVFAKKRLMALAKLLPAISLPYRLKL
jgi:hypothetical protein